MISLISITLFLLLSFLLILFYFVFTVINFANLYFWIINMSFPTSKLKEENVSPSPLDFPSLLAGRSKKSRPYLVVKGIFLEIYVNCIVGYSKNFGNC